MKKTILYCLLIIGAINLKSQDVTVEVDYPSVVRYGDQFNVTFVINSGGGEFRPPSFEGFYKIMGPQTSYSSSTQIINGRMSQSTTYTYVYYFQAIKEGVFNIAPASFTLKSKTYYSDSIRIEVTTGSAPTAKNNTGSTGTTDEVKVESGGKDIFIDVSLDRRDVFIGEHIVATVKLYTRIDLAGINEIKFPSFAGFLKSDIETPPLNSLRQENINGTAYGTGIIQQFLLYPQVTGELTIDPVQITALIQQRSGQSDPFFGDFFATYQTVPRAVISNQLKVNVRPLPGNKPDDFSGVVGKLNINASINKDTVNVNDAVNFKIIISGNGNLRLAEAPDLKLSPDIEIYDPKVTDNIKNSNNGTSGQKTFDYLLIPRHYGDFTIPALTYSFFNTEKGQYEHLTTNEFHFHALKGSENNTEITVYGGVSKEDVKYLGKDIRFIKSKPGRLDRSTEIISAKRSFYSSYAIAAFVFLVVLFIRREHIRRNADISAVKNRKAGKIAGRRLKEAAACLKNDETDRFHEEILKAMWGYLSDKLNIPVSELTRIRAIDILREKGIDDIGIEKMKNILDRCEYARYAPSSADSEVKDIYEATSGFISAVENLTG